MAVLAKPTSITRAVAAKTGPGRLNDAGQHRLINAVQPTHEDRLTVLDRRVAQEDVAQGRRNGERDDHRGHHGQAIGDGERLEERARQAADEKDRDQHDDIDQRGVNDRLANFERGFEDDSGGRFLDAFLAILAQAADDVLDVDDGIVDHDADRDDETGQDHRIERRAGVIQHEDAGHEREGNGQQADERGPPFEQEGDDNHRHEQAAEQQRRLQIVERDFDEIGRSENGRIDLHFRQTGLNFFDRLFDALGGLERIGPRILFDDQEQAGLAVDDGFASHRPGFHDDIGDIAQHERRAVLLLSVAEWGFGPTRSPI